MKLRIDVGGVAVRIEDADLTLRQVRSLLMDCFTIALHLPDDEPEKAEVDKAAPVGFTAHLDRVPDVEPAPYYDDEE